MNAPVPLPPLDTQVQGPDGTLALTRWPAPGKPVLVLIHGYPDNRRKWRAVAEILQQDFEVVAYDVRGAGDSFKPKGRAAYRLDRLTADFRAVIDAISPHAPVHLAAHDWGSVQGWEFVTETALAGRIASFTACSGPCLDHVGWWMREQMRRPSGQGVQNMLKQSIQSWYIYFFQLPWLPEALWHSVMGKKWPALMRAVERTPIEPRPTQASDGAHGVNLYRANFFQRLSHPRERIAHAPVQLLVATLDRYVSPAINGGLERWVPQLSRREIRAGHWVTLKEPALYAQAVREHIEQIQPPPSPAPSPAPVGPA